MAHSIIVQSACKYSSFLEKFVGSKPLIANLSKGQNQGTSIWFTLPCIFRNASSLRGSRQVYCDWLKGRLRENSAWLPISNTLRLHDNVELKLSQATIPWTGCATVSLASRGWTTPSSPRSKTPRFHARGANSEVSRSVTTG